MVFRILSLDGGGIRGVVAARMLETLEQRLQQPLGDYFDLIAGTSTGAIIAAGLAIGKTATELRQLYFEQGQQIFPYQSRFNLKRLGLVARYGLSAPKFSNDGLINVTRSQIGPNVVLKNISPDGQPSPQKLMITGYDTMRRQPIFFKSWRHERWYSAVKLWEACVCSASAPTYFPAYLLESPFNPSEQYSMIDGGVGVNNPTASAIAEAIRLLGEEQAAVSDGVPSLDRIINQITVVSVGTGDLTKSFPWRQVRSWGLAEWAPHIVDVIMDAPSDVQQYIAEQIATRARQDETPCYLRLQPKLRQEFEAIDNASTEYLAQLIDITDTYLATQQAAIAQTLQC